VPPPHRLDVEPVRTHQDVALQVARAVSDSGHGAQGQQGAASREAEMGRPPQEPEGGVQHALAGEGGGEEALLQRERDGEEPAPGVQGAAWGPAGRPLGPLFTDAAERGHIEWRSF